MDSILDSIFDVIDEMLLAGKFEEVDALLKTIQLEKHSVEFLLGILTVTLRAKTHLLQRDSFFKKVANTLESDENLIGLN